MSEGGQSSQEQWAQPNPSGKWKDMVTMVKDKHVAKKLQRKFEERARSSRSGRRNAGSRKRENTRAIIIR